MLATGFQHVAPTGNIGRDAEAEKAQTGFIEDHGGHLKGHHGEEGADEVRKDMVEEDPPFKEEEEVLSGPSTAKEREGEGKGSSRREL